MTMVRLDPPPELSVPIGEAMFTQRAIRRLDPNRDISDAHIKLMLEAASKAPSGGNVQPTRFLVVRDRQLIRDFGVLYHQAWWAKRRDEHGWTGWNDIPPDSRSRFAARLADEIGDAPLIILAFSTKRMGVGHSVYPNVQNLLLAARAGHRLGAHHPSSRRDGQRLRDVRGAGRFPVSLLHPARLPAREAWDDGTTLGVRDHLVEQLGAAPALVSANGSRSSGSIASMGSSACGRVETDFRLTVAAMVSANGGPARGNASTTGWFALGRGPIPTEARQGVVGTRGLTPSRSRYSWPSSMATAGAPHAGPARWRDQDGSQPGQSSSRRSAGGSGAPIVGVPWPRPTDQGACRTTDGEHASIRRPVERVARTTHRSGAA